MTMISGTVLNLLRRPLVRVPFTRHFDGAGSERSSHTIDTLDGESFPRTVSFDNALHLTGG